MIEVLLVITILAILAGMGVMTLRHQAERNVAAKNALEMQGVLQAAMSYNVDHQEWPASSSCNNSDFSACQDTPVTCSVSSLQQTADFVTGYLPNSKYTTSTGQAICWSTATNSEGHPDALNANRFWVEMKVPGLGAERLLTARRIAAKLPGAVVTDTLYNTSPNSVCTTSSTDCYVRAEVSQPGAAGNEAAGTHIVGTGVCDPLTGSDSTRGSGPCYQNEVEPLVQTGSDSTIKCSYSYKTFAQEPDFGYGVTFHCPTGQVGYIHASPGYFYSGYVGQSSVEAPILEGMYVVHDSSSPGPCTKISIAANEYHCDFTIVAQVIDTTTIPYSVKNNVNRSGNSAKYRDPQNGCAGANYVVYCVKPEAVATKASSY